MSTKFTLIKSFDRFSKETNEGKFWDWLTGKSETGKPEGSAGSGTVSDAKTEEFYKTLQDFADSGKSIAVQSRGNMEYSKMVEDIQLALSFLGYGLPKYGVDGLFGPETAAAILAFNSATKTDKEESTNESLINGFSKWSDLSKINESELSLIHI